jgi:hypothetical protein
MLSAVVTDADCRGDTFGHFAVPRVGGVTRNGGAAAEACWCFFPSFASGIMICRLVVYMCASRHWKSLHSVYTLLRTQKAQFKNWA